MIDTKKKSAGLTRSLALRVAVFERRHGGRVRLDGRRSRLLQTRRRRKRTRVVPARRTFR